jgi:ADP-ribosylglycohydrolase
MADGSGTSSAREIGSLPPDYAERVYAGVLGKVIGVYLGRPFEGWTYQMIQQRLGDVAYYVHEALGVPLIVTDDDISGTFTFVRALEDHGTGRALTAREIGQSWLNYLIRERTVLWWGGLGNSTEHTAYLRLAAGIEAPESGSMARNGKVVAEQIGAQIFIDGWAMVCPGDPDQAVRFAEAAARVSHDGEAVFGAKVLAAMEALAFVEADIQTLIDRALTYIPTDSVIATMIGDIRDWHAAEKDWRATREQIEARYGYEKYGGNCHMVPNHGLIVHSLLHGEGDFSETLKIINTCGWDTDCNSGNVGCLMGIRGGLAAIDAGLERGLDWRGPVADRIYMPTADGGRGISDCLQEAVHIVNMGRALQGEQPLEPKDGAQFHFSLPGALQGFQIAEGKASLANTEAEDHNRVLAIAAGTDARAGTPVFTPSKEVARFFDGLGYALMASPRVFPGQTLSARLRSPGDGQTANLYIAFYGEDDEPCILDGNAVPLPAGAWTTLALEMPPVAGPIFEVGVRVSEGLTELDRLQWTGTPELSYERPRHKGTMWRRAWVNGVDDLVTWRHLPELFRLIQNQGLGLLMHGTREWRDYTVSARIRPHMVTRTGVAVRVQGMTRFYGLLLAPGGRAQLVRMLHGETVLVETVFDWQFGETYELGLTAEGDRLIGRIDGRTVLDHTDDALSDGAAGLVVEEGRSEILEVRIGSQP